METAGQIMCGDRVRVPKGTPLRSRHPKRKEYVAGRTYWVTVAKVIPGRSDQPDLYDKDVVHAENPRVAWPGSSGYLVSADVNDVEKQ